jgi:hypothetical protein
MSSKLFNAASFSVIFFSFFYFGSGVQMLLSEVFIVVVQFFHLSCHGSYDILSEHYFSFGLITKIFLSHLNYTLHKVHPNLTRLVAQLFFLFR